MEGVGPVEQAVNFDPDPSVKIGHATNSEALTGCTVVIFKDGAVGGVDVRGSATGSREIELLRPMQRVGQVHGLLLTGGSAFGLDAAGGVMAWLEERKIGFKNAAGFTIPIVPAAVLFDLGIGNYRVRPDKAMGYEACCNAKSGYVEEGNVGAGTGATVCKILNKDYRVKSGLGAWWEDLGNGLTVSAVVAVNALGDILDESGRLMVGPRDRKTGQIYSTMSVWKKKASDLKMFGDYSIGINTTLAVVVTSASLTKAQANKVAQMANTGLARCIEPAHTEYDGDITFALATGKVSADASLIGAVAARVLETAVRRAIRAAWSVDGIPAYRDICKENERRQR